VRPSSISILSALAAIALLPASVAGGGCWLGTTVNGGSILDVKIGEVVSIEGYEFALGEVEIAISVDGAPLRTETRTAADLNDLNGYWWIDITPQEGEDGMWQIVATEVNGSCSVSAAFPVVPAPTEPAPPVVPDTASGSPEVASSLPVLLGAALLVLSGLSLRRPSQPGQDQPL
jgi:hypothetical protein